MSGSNAFGAPPRAEGVPVSGVYYNRASSLIVGGEAGTVAGVGGLSIGRFAWAAPDGRCLNQRTSDQDLLGLVVWQGGDWRRVFWDEVTFSWKIREGMNVTLLTRAPGEWVRIPSGGQWGEAIYTSPLDGVPVAGYADGLEATPWSLARPARGDSLSLITTWNSVL